MSVTMRDIAAETGLSVSTVSKYLNGGKVKEKNRVKIEASVRAHDFRPNEIARGLRSSRTRTVGVLIPDFRSAFSAEIVGAAEEALFAAGYGTFAVDNGGSREREKRMLDFLVGKMVDGVIIQPGYLSAEDFGELERRGVPFVVIDQDAEGLKADKVFVDNFRATYGAVRYLAARGHRKIGYLGGQERLFTAKERLRGYLQGMAEAGVTDAERLIWRGEFLPESGYRGTVSLLERGVTALLYSSFDLTLGGILAINESNLRLAEDISAVGFDDIFFSKLIRPKLTTIRQPMEEMGKAAVELLLARIADPDRPKETRVLSTELLANQSVKTL